MVTVTSFFLVGAFEEKCPTLTVGSFLDAYAPLFCSFVQQIDVRILKTYSNRQNFVQNKKQNRRPEPRKHTKESPFDYLGVFHLDFSALWDFFRKFLDSTKGSPFNFFDVFQQNGR